MSIMKGKLRRSAVVVAFSLGAFQALSIIGANVAQAGNRLWSVQRLAS